MSVDVADAQPAGSLAEAEELVVDEDILDVVELVDVLHNCLTLILYKGLDESISADGNTKANVAVNHKRRGREQGNELREGGIGIEHALCCSVRISRDTLDENLGLVEIEVEASVLLEYMLVSESTSRATDRLALPSSAYATAHASWWCLSRVRLHQPCRLALM